MKLTNLKAIVSGRVVEIFEYEKSLAYEFTTKNNPHSVGKEDEESTETKEDIRKRSMRRAKTWVSRLIHANVWSWKQLDGVPFPPAFITFTFAENLSDVSHANKIFSLFIKRLNFNIYKKKKSHLKYIVVTEFQKRGAVHFHCLFFNLPIGIVEHERVTRRIAQVWGHGFIDIEDVNDVEKAIAYLTKYMLKGFEDSRLDGKKRYFGSRKLERPKIIRLQHLVELIRNSISPEKMIYENIYESEYQGTTKYSRYQLDIGEQLRLKKEEIRSTIPINNSPT